MDVGVFTGVGEVEVRSEPSPEPGPNQVLVEIGACGICTFERRLFSGEKEWYPLAPGHEAAGLVSAIGSGVEGLHGSPQVGDRVAIDLLTRCGTCGPCRRGRSALCRHRQGRLLSDGTTSFGGFSSQVVVDARSTYSVADAPIEHAAMAEPIACTVHSMRQGGFQPGDRVAVIGGGFMGRLHLALSRLDGAAGVGVVDVSADRLGEAKDAGATWTALPQDALEIGGKQDVVFVTATEGLELAVELADLGATIVLYSAFGKDKTISIGADKAHREEISIVGAFSQEPADWQLATAHIRSGLLAPDLDALITATFEFDNLAEAMTLVTSEPTFRVFVKPASAI